jgi:hypothetical protein
MFLQNTGCLAAEQAQLFFWGVSKIWNGSGKGPDLSEHLHPTTTHF